MLLMTWISRHPSGRSPKLRSTEAPDTDFIEEIVAADTLGPIDHERLLDGQHITPTDIERTATSLTALTS